MYERSIMLCTVVVEALVLFSCGGRAPAQAKSSPVLAEPAEAPVKPIKRRFTSADLITGYWQDEQKNCTAVAFTKVVLDRYGSASGLFAATDYEKDENGVSARTAKGTELVVSTEQVRQASSALGVKHTNEQAFEEATILFALLAAACAKDCSGRQMYCQPTRGESGAPRRCDTYETALQYIDQGLDWDGPPNLLEMTEFRSLKGIWLTKWFRIRSFVRNGGACVAATPWHTYFVADGGYDRYGHYVAFNHTGSKLGFEALHAYCLGASSLETEASSVAETDAHFAAEMSPSP